MLMRAVLIMCLPQTGKLQLYDLASGNLLETIDAHDGALWSLSLSPDQVTKPDVKIWASVLWLHFPFLISSFIAA